MPHAMSRRGRDVVLAIFALALAAVLVGGSIGLPPPRYEPMGSAALPRILAGLISLFAVVILFNALRQPAADGAAEGRMEASPLRSLAAFAALLGYVAALDIGRAPFVIATVAFVTVLGLILAKPAPRTALLFLLFGLLLALGIDSVFTKFLYVDLG